MRYLGRASLFAVALVSIAGCLRQGNPPPPAMPTVSNFEACRTAGYPMMESYPARCRTPDGRTFTQEVADQPTVTSGDNPPPGSAVHDLPVPPAVAAVRAHVAQQLGITARQVLVLEALEHEWPNSCLGVPKPGQACAQVTTPGYRVTVRAKGQELTFRTNGDGSVIETEE